jgi:DNA-binding transcriptional regulator PaaX
MKQKGEATKKILQKLSTGGAIIFAAQSPYFWLKLYKKLFSDQNFSKKKTTDAFSYLKKRGLIDIEKKNNQIYISLTKKGEGEAGKFQINKIKIEPQKKWDKKWRLIIFDIPETVRIKREAFRGKLKELGFCQLQKSVWVYPYPCEKEIEILRGFFGLTKEQLRFFIVEKIEEDKFFLKYFKLS